MVRSRVLVVQLVDMCFGCVAHRPVEYFHGESGESKGIFTVYQVCVFISVLGNNSYVLALVSKSVILM